MGWGVIYPGPPPEKPMPVCPICGEECETYFFDAANMIVGCDHCISERDAYEYLEEAKNG